LFQLQNYEIFWYFPILFVILHEKYQTTMPRKTDGILFELRLCTVMQHVTIQRFMYNSGLKYQSAKRYLDSLCMGDSPRLQRYKESRMWHYRVLPTTTLPEK
jgi:predicted transcriptional regulator